MNGPLLLNLRALALQWRKKDGIVLVVPISIFKCSIRAYHIYLQVLHQSLLHKIERKKITSMTRTGAYNPSKCKVVFRLFSSFCKERFPLKTDSILFLIMPNRNGMPCLSASSLLSSIEYLELLFACLSSSNALLEMSNCSIFSC